MKDLINKLSPHEKLNQAEAVMVEAVASGACNFIDMPLHHKFIKGMYIRTIFMPAGTLLTSKIHKTNHPYRVLKGKASVWIDDDNCQTIEAPYKGITYPGTRRILYIHEDCIWRTFHKTNKRTPEEVEEEIIEKNDNPYLPDFIKDVFNLNKKEELCLMPQ